jgi:predicted acetyltransferase/catechol 2,3-dioxygenase-like lactoylglutathione lyase family enzyme
MQLVRLHHAQITVERDEVEAARTFYLQTLGLREIPKPEPLVKRGGFWMEIGGQQVHVGVEEGVDRAATKAHLAYEVQDIGAWRVFFAGRGVETSGNEPIPGYDRFEFRDPFGNRVEFIEPIVELVRPHGRAKASFLAAAEEFAPEGRYMEVTPGTVDAVIERMLLDETEPEYGKVPDTILWLVRGDHFIGRLSIRHRLNAKLEKFGGHIGYELRPSERGKGYGTLILRLGLDWARRLGLKRAMLTTDVTNERSIRVIKANGAVLHDRIRVDGRDIDTYRWWIEL